MNISQITEGNILSMPCSTAAVASTCNMDTNSAVPSCNTVSPVPLDVKSEKNGASSSNPSLHCLIARVRRGENRHQLQPRGSWSANSNPDRTEEKKRVVSLDLSDLADTRQSLLGRATLKESWDEINSYPPVWDEACRDLVKDAPTRSMEQSARLEATPRVADHLVQASARTDNADVIASQAASLAMVEAVLEITAPEETLRLPDPSTIKDRKELFAVSRNMCSRSFVESFGGVHYHSNGGGSDMAPQDTYQNPRKTTRSMWESGGSIASHSMFSEDDDDLSLHSGPLHRHWPTPDEHGSIAFSVDSIKVRKHQCDKSQYTDWAIDDSHHYRDGGDAFGPEDHDEILQSSDKNVSIFPPQQTVYEFDMMSLHEHEAKVQREDDGDHKMQL